MATIEKIDKRYMVLYDDDNKVVASEVIPPSGKTLVLEVRLLNIAKENGLRVR